jgi:WD40 repeat protein
MMLFKNVRFKVQSIRVAVKIALTALSCAGLIGCASTPGRDQPLSNVMGVACSADGRTIAATTTTEEVALFDLAPLRFRALLTPEGANAQVDLSKRALFRSPPLAYSPDGTLLVVAGVGGEVVGWNVELRQVRFRIPLAERAIDVAFKPDGASFFVASRSIRHFSADDGALLDELTGPANTTIMALAVSPDGKILRAGLSDGQIAEFDLPKGTVVRTLKAHALAVSGLAVAPDGSAFASTAGRFDPRIWDAKVDPPVQVRLADLPGMGTSLDKSTQTASGLMMFAWLLGTAAGFHTVGAPTMGAPPVGVPSVDQAAAMTSELCDPDIAYSRDGRYLATTVLLSTLAGEIHVVVADVLQRKVRTISGVYGCSIAFSADSKFVITGGLGAPQVWNAETGERVQ